MRQLFWSVIMQSREFIEDVTRFPDDQSPPEGTGRIRKVHPSLSVLEVLMAGLSQEQQHKLNQIREVMFNEEEDW